VQINRHFLKEELQINDQNIWKKTQNYLPSRKYKLKTQRDNRFPVRRAVIKKTKKKERKKEIKVKIWKKGNSYSLLV
jgi:6-pyruvoyl-tetrahydropterin synthase